MQRYKIYINESPLILTQSSDLEDETVFERTLIHAKYRGKPKMLINYIELLEKNKHHEGIIIQADNVRQLWKDFRSLYYYIKAGGGLVINPFGKVLLIFRRGVWDLPKGKQDPGETLAQTAVAGSKGGNWLIRSKDHRETRKRLSLLHDEPATHPQADTMVSYANAEA
jgi:hypothetical protein